MTPLLPLLLASPAAAQATGDAAFQSHLDQAAFFARKRWFEDASAEIALALETPEGRLSYEAHWLGARIALENLDVARSLELAETASRLAGDPEAAELAAAWAWNLRASFGFLRVSTSQPGVVSRLQVEPTSAILDPALKEFASKAALRWRDRTPLPATLALPAGSWLVNGQPAEVPAGQTSALELPLRVAGSGALAALQVTRLELAAGVGQWLGPRVANLLPAVRTQVSLTQPAGPLLLGLSAEAQLQGYDAADRQVHVEPYGWALGARVGAEVFLGGPLALRPNLTLRAAQVPGIALACDQGDAAWTCGFDEGQAPAHHVYVAGRALVPGFELLVEHRESGRTTALGTGVKISVEQAIGRLPASGEAMDSEGASHPWETADRAWTATSLSMLANVALAF